MKKKRVISVIMLVALMAAMFTGCGNSAGSTKSTGNTKENKDLTLTVYAGINEEPANGLCKAFEKETGIKTSVVRMSGGEILARIQAEKDNPKASVWFGGPAETFIQAEF
jgi:iron(III) transport system substrate-binding protein